MGVVSDINCSQQCNIQSDVAMRNANPELYRILLMFLIVLTHMAAERAGGWTLLSLCKLTTWHVDGFIAISGWYGIRFDWSKVIRILGIVVFYDVIRLGARAMWPEEHFEFSWIGGWFVSAYLFLMFLSPLANAGIDALWKKSRREAVIGCLLPVLFVALRWLRGDLTASVSLAQFDSYTIVNMVAVYVIARLARRLYDVGYIKNLDAIAVPVFIFGLFVAGLVPWLRTSGRMTLLDYMRFSHYNAPHVWLMAVGMLYFFIERVRMSRRMECIVRFTAPSMFGVYLAHSGPHINRIFSVASGFLPVPVFFKIFIGAVAVFAFCILLDFVRRAIVNACGILIKYHSKNFEWWFK